MQHNRVTEGNLFCNLKISDMPRRDCKPHITHCDNWPMCHNGPTVYQQHTYTLTTYIDSSRWSFHIKSRIFHNSTDVICFCNKLHVTTSFQFFLSVICYSVASMDCCCNATIFTLCKQFSPSKSSSEDCRDNQSKSSTDWLIEHGLTSAPTQYRLYGQRFSTSYKSNSIKH